MIKENSNSVSAGFANGAATSGNGNASTSSSSGASAVNAPPSCLGNVLSKIALSEKQLKSR